MSLNRAPWTDDENERLKAFVAQGLSIIRAAAAFKRNTKGVRIQARRLGTPFPRMKEFRKKFPDVPSNFWRQH